MRMTCVITKYGRDLIFPQLSVTLSRVSLALSNLVSNLFSLFRGCHIVLSVILSVIFLLDTIPRSD